MMTIANPVEILLVEDNYRDEELALLSLDEYNLANKVEVVRDGEEALDFIFRRGAYADRDPSNPKLILLDLKLPKVDGLEVLREIRSNPETKNVPVVVLTSSKEDQDIKECYELKVNSYIVKPVDFDQFTKSVKELGFYWVLLNEPPPK